MKFNNLFIFINFISFFKFNNGFVIQNNLKIIPTPAINPRSLLFSSSVSTSDVDNIIDSVDVDSVDVDSVDVDSVVDNVAPSNVNEDDADADDHVIGGDYQRNSVLFFPGKLNRVLPRELYNSFLNKLSGNRNTYVATPSLENNMKLVSNITTNENLCVVSHSTSANDAIELCQNSENIASLVLIDPIDYLFFKNDFDFDQFNVFKFLEQTQDLEENISSFIEADKLELFMNSVFKPNSNKKTKLNNKVLVLNSKISNRWKIFPPIPPISKYAINLRKIKKKEIRVIDDFGHFDILDTTWANAAHNTFSKGSPLRDPDNIESYHETLVEHIDTFNEL
mgnify:CR=1 FL=1